jgi:hypothetical protein
MVFLDNGLEGETGTSASNLVVYYDQDYQDQEEDLQQRKQNLSAILRGTYQIKEDKDQEIE